MRLIFAMLLICQSAFAGLDAEGWTVLAPSTDSRVVYVSSSTGNDANDGLSPDTPKKTMAAGHSLVRNGMPDWMLLKSGDVWESESLYWKRSGDSVDRKAVLSSYGDGVRPVIKNAMFRDLESDISHVAIVGIDFYASFNDPASPDFGQGVAPGFGVQIATSTGNDLLLEGNHFRFYGTNVQIRRAGGIGPLLTNVSIRRNVITDAQAFGLTVTWVDGVLLEENTFDRSGWDNRTKFLHNVYVKEDRNLTARGNIFSRGGNFGLKISADKKESFTDFVIEDNLFYQSALSIGHSSGATGYDPNIDVGTLNGIVNQNVFLSPGKTLPFDSINTQTLATLLQNLRNVTFDANIFTHNNQYLNTGQAFGFSQTELNADIAVTNSKIHDWLSSHFNNTGSYMKNAELIVNLTESNNFPEGVVYADPDRDFTTYSLSLGGEADPEAFLTRATQQRRVNWDTRYTATAFNDHIREGFNVTSNEPEPEPTTKQAIIEKLIELQELVNSLP